MKSPCQWFVYRPTASDSLESGQQQHLRPWNSLHIEKIFTIQRRLSYRNFFERFDWNSTRTTSPSRLKVGSIEGPTQIVTSITYSWMQCKMQLNCVTRPSWLMTSEINGDLDPDIPPKNFKKISKSAKKIFYGVVKQFYDFLYFAVNPACFR